MRAISTLAATVTAFGIALAMPAAGAPASPTPPVQAKEASVVLVANRYGKRKHFGPRRAFKREARREFRREVRREFRQDRRQFRRELRRDNRYGYAKPRAVKPRFKGKAFKAGPRYRIGKRFPHGIRKHYIHRPHLYGLRAPKYGYGWVRYDRDFYLVALGTGLIVNALLY